jgi:tRNA (cmo5U34)-methyltransferase
MLAVARKRLEAEGLLARTQLHVGELHTLPAGPLFDGAQMMGVLHHLEGEPARLLLLQELARRLEPGAPLVLGCRVGMDAALLNVELRRLRTYGIPLAELEERRQRMASLRPIASDAALFELCAQAGFVAPRTLFVALQYKVILVRCEPRAVD